MSVFLVVSRGGAPAFGPAPTIFVDMIGDENSQAERYS
jgi:hypothetical protein